MNASRAFMELTEANCASIRSVGAIIDRALPVALDRLYDQIRKTPETQRFFASESDIARARQAQQDHWRNISSANLGEAYAARVQAIGAVHARIGLEPKWYIGGYAIVVDHLIHAVVAELFPRKSGLRRASANKGEILADIIGSLCKAVFLEMDMTISVYLEEAERAREAAREDAIGKEQELIKRSFGAVLGQIAGRDLSSTVQADLPAAYLPLRENLNVAITALRDTLGLVNTTVQTIDTAAGEISSTAQDLASRTERQATSVEKTASTIEQITTAISAIAEQVSQANTFVAECETVTEQFGVMVARANKAMAAIAQSSDAIGKITNVMDSIAMRTHLLALNTAVEAARAGEAGNSFKVLSQEIRDLASRAADASKDVRGLVGTSRAQVATGVSVMDEAGEAIGTIISGVTEIGSHLKTIAVAAQEQAGALHDINDVVSMIDQGTRQNATMVEQTSIASTSMARQVVDLRNQLASFRLVHTDRLPPAPTRRQELAPAHARTRISLSPRQQERITKTGSQR